MELEELKAPHTTAIPKREQETFSFRVGIMKMIMGAEQEHYNQIVQTAVDGLESLIGRNFIDLKIDLFEFKGPTSISGESNFSVFDFFQVALTEKIERRFHFLILITEVDLSPSGKSYTLALPSRLTNIGIISLKRLSPEFWGDPDPDGKFVVSRLSTMMLHTLGHLLGLPHDKDPKNVMHGFQEVEEIDLMNEIRPGQIEKMRKNLPKETHEKIETKDRFIFTLKCIARNFFSIWRATARSNPFRIVMHLPTMIAAGITVDSVLFFTAEIWDFASTIEVGALAVFSLLCIFFSTYVLYKSFALKIFPIRTKFISESTIVTASATLLSLIITLFLFYLLFYLLIYTSAIVFFPEELKNTWPTVDPAVKTIDHVRMGMFLAAMAVLTGSLGGATENKYLVQRVLFVDEET